MVPKTPTTHAALPSSVATATQTMTAPTIMRIDRPCFPLAKSTNFSTTLLLYLL